MGSLKAEFGVRVREIFKADPREQKKAIRGTVFYLGKARQLCRGRYPALIARAQSAGGGDLWRARGQQVMAGSIRCRPAIAAITVHAGGGLELALACHSRICTDDAKTVLGLPGNFGRLLPGSVERSVCRAGWR